MSHILPRHLLLLAVSSLLLSGCAFRTFYDWAGAGDRYEARRTLFSDSMTTIDFSHWITVTPFESRMLSIEIGGEGHYRLDSIGVVVRGAGIRDVQVSGQAGTVEYRALGATKHWFGTTDTQLSNVSDSARHVSPGGFRTLKTTVTLPIPAAELPDTLIVDLIVSGWRETSALVARETFTLVRQTKCYNAFRH